MLSSEALPRTAAWQQTHQLVSSVPSTWAALPNFSSPSGEEKKETPRIVVASLFPKHLRRRKNFRVFLPDLAMTRDERRAWLPCVCCRGRSLHGRRCVSYPALLPFDRERRREQMENRAFLPGHSRSAREDAHRTGQAGTWNCFGESAVSSDFPRGAGGERYCTNSSAFFSLTWADYKLGVIGGPQESPASVTLINLPVL